jgi:hypothetical protein
MQEPARDLIERRGEDFLGAFSPDGFDWRDGTG